MDFVILALLLLVVAAYVRLQMHAERDWDGLYGFAGKAPMAGWLLWLALLMADMTRDPASHSLWPFEVVIGLGAGQSLPCGLVRRAPHCQLTQQINRLCG